MDSDSTEQRQDRPADAPSAVPWSFRRFGSDKQAQCASDTWDQLHSQAAPLLQGINDRQRDLYQAENNLQQALEATRVPRTRDCSSASRESVSAAHKVLQTLKETLDAAGPAPVFEPTLDTLLVGGLRQPHGGSSTTTLSIELTRAEAEELQGQLQRWIESSRRVVGCCEAAIASATGAREVLGTYNSRVRDFILTVWQTNAEQAKSHPPFFLDLGPLDPSLYGMGRSKPPAPAAAPRPPLSTTSSGNPSNGT